MAKILLVEDDNNLREIFEMRLKAEGFNIVSAHDGEEALVVAMKEKPDLVISDVMMPKLSGFEMIETLKASPEMKNVKVIMMTALGQAEDRAQGDKLGVDRYLVKSQVTLEDFVKVTHEVLEGSSPPPPPAAPAPATTTAPDSPQPAKVEPAKPEPVSTPPPTQDVAPILAQTPPAVSADSSNEPPASPTPAPTSTASSQQTQSEELAAVEEQIKEFVETSQPTPAPATAEAPQPSPDSNSSSASPNREKVIKPLEGQATEPDINAIAAKEEAEKHKDDPVSNPPTGTVLSAGDSSPVEPPVTPSDSPPQTPSPTAPGSTVAPQKPPGSNSSDPNAVAL